jgi:DNA-binding winged helix-turn-helix (wHTH) protein
VLAAREEDPVAQVGRVGDGGLDRNRATTSLSGNARVGPLSLEANRIAAKAARDFVERGRGPRQVAVISTGQAGLARNPRASSNVNDGVGQGGSHRDVFDEIPTRAVWCRGVQVRQSRVSFGDFVLDRGTRQLLRDGTPRRLAPNAFELLELLLQFRPNVVSRERIRDRLWPGTHVTDSTLATVVAEVRSALVEDPRVPRLLRTVHGVGYAFCGVAEESGPPVPSDRSVAYRLVLADREVALRPGENLLGRVEAGVTWIDAPTVSRRHARILVEHERATIEDLGSKNGTFVRGVRISAPTPLAAGDVIRLGRVSIKVQAVRVDKSTATGTD